MDAFATLHKTEGPKKFVARSAGAKDAAATATTSALPTSKSAYKPPGQASNDAEAIAERRRKNELRAARERLVAVQEKEGTARIAIDKECTAASEELVKDEVVGAEEAKAAEEARIEEEKKNYDVVSLTKREWDARNLAALFTCKDDVVYLLHAEQNLLNDFMGQVLHSFAVEGAHTVVSSLDDLKLEEMPAEVELKFRKLSEPTGDFAEELVRPRDAAKIRQNVQKLLAKNTNLRMAQIEKHVVETVVCTPDLEHVTSIYALMKASTQIPHTQAIHALTLVGCEGVKTNMALARLCKDASTVAYITAALADCMDQDRRKFLGSLKALLGVAADSEAVAGIDLCAEAYEHTLREEEERVEAERVERERAEKERLEAAERAAEEAEQRRKEREADAARAGPSSDAPAVLRAPKDNKLASKWVLWHTPKLEAGATGWVQPRPMCTISDVPTFWAMAGALPPASSLDNKCAYAMFREGVEPKWEDEANKSGGQWVATINPRDSNINDGWSELLVKCVGESFTRYQNKVVGVQLECKTLWRLTLWLNDAHGQVRDQLGDEFERVLRGRLDKQSPEIQFHLNSKISLNGGKVCFFSRVCFPRLIVVVVVVVSLSFLFFCVWFLPPLQHLFCFLYRCRARTPRRSSSRSVWTASSTRTAVIPPPPVGMDGMGPSTTTQHRHGVASYATYSFKTKVRVKVGEEADSSSPTSLPHLPPPPPVDPDSNTTPPSPSPFLAQKNTSHSPRTPLSPSPLDPLALPPSSPPPPPFSHPSRRVHLPPPSPPVPTPFHSFVRVSNGKKKQLKKTKQVRGGAFKNRCM